jgi:hypothetical protein
VQGGEDSNTQNEGGDQVPGDPQEEGAARLGRSRSGNRSPLFGAVDAHRAAASLDAAETAGEDATGSPTTADSAGLGGPAMELSPIFRSWSDPAAAANAPERCHFLRGISDSGRLVDPQREAVPTHRCAAFGEPLPLSLRQQELVCLQRVHVSCPRYLRGALLASESVVEPTPVRVQSGISKVMAAGLVLVLVAALLGAAALSGLVPGVGGKASANPSTLAVVTFSPTATASATDVAGSSSTPTASPSQTAHATPSATGTPVPTASPLPTPWPACPPGARGGRMVCLVPCPDQAKCFEYMVHQGDKLNQIAYYFGVTMKQIWAMNLWLNNGTAIKPGEILRLPPPTK